jgi:DNA-binding NtrC family response regulator
LGLEVRKDSQLAENSRPTVLIVDDDALMRWSLTESLGNSGYAVTDAGDGRTAVAAIERAARPFDVVLLDYRLPDSTDMALLDKVKRLSPESQVILMTSYISEIAPGAGVGAYKVISKPFEIDSLNALVDEARVEKLAGS